MIQKNINKITFHFDQYIQVMPDHKKKLDREFLEYFIGFFEGNGSLYINQYNNQVQFYLYQHENNISFLHKLRTGLGFGRVFISKTKSHQAYLKISNENNLLKIIHLLNGNLCTASQREEFKLFLDMFNKKYHYSIILKSSSPVVSLDTAWLSGFIDAQGRFSCYTNKDQTGDSNLIVRPIFYISQETKSIVEDIRDLLIKTNTNLYYEPIRKHYTLKLSSAKSRKKLIQYLQRYKLKTRKRITYLGWKNIHFFIKDKKHLSDQGSITINKMINRMRQVNQQI